VASEGVWYHRLLSEPHDSPQFSWDLILLKVAHDPLPTIASCAPVEPPESAIPDEPNPAEVAIAQTAQQSADVGCCCEPAREQRLLELQCRREPDPATYR